LGGWDDSETLHQAVIDAYEAGVTVVAAAGNEWGGPVLYPAKYPETIAVSATNHYDQLAWFSSIGPEVDVAAPGEDILSILPGNSYAWWSGTSMAAPHVTGAIGLLLSLLDPTPAEIRDCIMDSADDLGDPGLDPYFGAGRLNLAAFLAECGGPPPVPVRKCLGEICTNPDDGKQPIQGTAGDDVICGTDGDDIILAKGGNDLICCGGGNDIVDAGDGNDKVDCGPGDDVIKGGSGKDVLIGNAGDDIILGSTQDDVLEGGPGKDHLYGGDGNDVLFGRDGDDQLCGLPGKDYLNAGVGANQCDKTGNGCPPVLTPCPIINALEISSSSLTPALTNSLNVMNGLGISLDVNQ
jgi:Ca2+-binding RTX toxin-like protein